MKLDAYILKQVLVAFAFAVGGMLFVALPGIAVSAVHRLSGVDMIAILKFVPLLLVGLVPYVLPLGFLLAVVMTYGRMAADNEWTAIRMTGLNPLRTLAAPLAFALVMCAGNFWLLGWQLPQIKARQKAYVVDTVRDIIKNLSPGRTDLNFGRFYLQSNFRDGDAFVDAFIHLPEEDRTQSFLADRVTFHFEPDAMLVTLRNARAVLASGDSVRQGMVTVRVDWDQLVAPPEEARRKISHQSVSELRAWLADGSVPEGKEAAVRYEVHSRVALATTYLVFLLLGVPVGILMRMGTQLAALTTAVGCALVYHLLQMQIGEELVKSGLVPPWVGAWLVNGLGAAAGALLLRRTLAE